MSKPALNPPAKFDLLLFSEQRVSARDGQELQGESANTDMIAPVTR
jgi:hypothetical protein